MPQLFPNETNFTLVPKGIHPAVCCEFVDLDVVETKWGKRHKAKWVFQVDSREEDGRRQEVHCKFNLTVGTAKKPSKVQKFMGKWRGQAYTEAELKNGDVDPERPVGQPCMLDIEHMTLEDGTTIYYVDNILPPGEIRLKPENYVPVAQRERGKTGSDEDSNDPDTGAAAPASPPPPAAPAAPPSTAAPPPPPAGAASTGAISGAQQDRPPF